MIYYKAIKKMSYDVKYKKNYIFLTKCNISHLQYKKVPFIWKPDRAN
jgi:hypothetical protein